MKNSRIVAIAGLGLVAVLALAGCSAASVAPSSLDAQGTTGSQGSQTTGEVTVTISGGHGTDPVDNGRPVVLVAAALGVPTGVFREAFSGVTPAGAGEQPEDTQVRLNKSALLEVLAPYGITNEQLDAASDFYRYNGSSGGTWAHTDATAVAVLTDGKVSSIIVTTAGAGYSSTPTVTLSTGQTATATLAYGTDTATNGSIESISLD